MSLRGIRFCVTGVLCVERARVFENIRAAGAVAETTVNWGTNFLVIGEKPGSTKLRAAKKYGVPVIDEPKFWKMLPRQFRPFRAPTGGGGIAMGLDLSDLPEEDDVTGKPEKDPEPQKRKFDWS